MFRRLMTLDEAKQIISKYSPSEPLGSEEVALLRAYNRVLAEDAISTLDIPPFNRSTVDGYAVRAQDTFGIEEDRPIKLKVCGTVTVGEKPRIKIDNGEAAEIVTGAPIPNGADAVVMLEDIERKNDQLYVYSAVAKDENIMKAGADIKKGETVLRKNQLLTSREIGALAAIGLAKVKAYVLPRVSIISTGAEVAKLGRKLPAGKVYDTNAYSLSTAVQESRGIPIYLGVFPDDFGKMRQVLAKALSSSDVVITSGGVSIGPKDVMPKVLDSLGKPGIIVHGIAIKPGKPVTVASVDGRLIFSLPGHPTSALLVFYLLVRPIIERLAGKKADETLQVKAVTSTRMFSAKGRRTFIMVKLKDGPIGLMAEPVAAGLSGAITTLTNADGFVEIAENQQFVDAGEKVTVRLFRKPSC